MIDVSKDTFFLDAYELAHNLEYYIQNNIFIATSSVALEDLAEGYSESGKEQKVVQALKSYSKCQVIPLRETYLEELESSVGINAYSNGLKHLACAYQFDKNLKPDETVFVCADYATCIYANYLFGEDSIIWARDKNRPY